MADANWNHSINRIYTPLRQQVTAHGCSRAEQVACRGSGPYLVASSGPFLGEPPEGTHTIARLPGFPLVLRLLPELLTRKDLGPMTGNPELLVL